MSLPVGSQDVQRFVRKRHISVLGALAAMNMDTHAMAVDVADLKVQSLVQPEPASVDHGQVGLVLGCTHCIENAPDFFEAQHSG